MEAVYRRPVQEAGAGGSIPLMNVPETVLSREQSLSSGDARTMNNPVSMAPMRAWLSANWNG